MTTIRRINVSQINGGMADTDDPGEIRPFGETSFYIDEYGPTDKLTLLMFDGQRTHLKSKVLAPGILYGSDADSGDGVGLDTIKLIPDAYIKSQGSDQYLIVDPTAPNHIHLRAGGTIDGSSADLYLGGEYNNVRISDGYDSVNVKTSQIGEGVISYDWYFDNSGKLSLPMGGALEPVGMGWTGLTNNNSGTPISIVNKTTNMTYAGQVISDITVSGNSDTQGRISINTQDLVTPNTHSWIFDYNGTMIFPDNSVQTSAWSGGRVVSAPTHSTGASGDKLGDLAFTSGYIYYCTANYTGPTVYNTTLTREGVSTNTLYVATSVVIQDPTGGTLQLNPFINGTTVNILSATVDGSEWALSIDVNASVPNETPVRITLPVTQNIWKRVAWSNDTW